MAVLIISPAPGGKTRYCAANCHNAKLPDCVCVCRGLNHSVGSEQAAINTHDHYQQITNDPDEPKEILSSFQLSLDQLMLHGEKNQ
jgi:hypothetical protein